MSFTSFDHTAISVPTIAIIGGGLSGTLVAAHLLQRAREPLSIYLIERRPRVGPGVAYSTPLDCHVLNVPAGGVRVWNGDMARANGSDCPDFLTWLQTVAGMEATPHDFVPRHWFGLYVQAELQAAIAHRHPQVQLSIVQDEALQISVTNQRAIVHLGRGQRLQADRVVLALGNLPPAPVPIANPQFYKSSAYIDSGWVDALDEVLEHPSLLILGTGLTAVDWLVALHHRGYSGTIHLLSRRGLLPQVHRSPSSTETVPLDSPSRADFSSHETWPQTVRGWTRWMRQRGAIAHSLGEDWQTVIDSLRHHTQTIWQQLSLEEKRRFLRHVRPYWDSHRHRIAPQVHQTVQAMQAVGQVQVHAGWLHTCTVQGDQARVQFRPRGQATMQSLNVGAVINCTGPHLNYRKLRHPLMCSLLHQGIVRCDALRLGLDTTSDGALINARGLPSSWLYTLGPTRRGQLWETTAIAEIRDQAAALAKTLLLSRNQPLISPEASIYITATH